jgi:pimeloyl-ACP methyl ester carboxylesterase
MIRINGDSTMVTRPHTMQESGFVLRQTRLPDGDVLSCWEREGADLPCVLVHGLADSAATWKATAEKISPNCRLLLPDLRGHGYSAWLHEDDYTSTGLANALIEQLRRLDVDECILIGHSLGAAVCLEMHRIQSIAIAGLAFVDYNPFLGMESVTRLIDVFSKAFRTYQTREDFIGSLLNVLPRVGVDVAEELFDNYLKPAPDGGFMSQADPAVIQILRNLRRSYMLNPHLDRKFRSLLSGITCPSLIVRGAHSALLSEGKAIEMVNSITFPPIYREVPSSGHAIPLEQPGPLARILSGFIGSAALSAET